MKLVFTHSAQRDLMRLRDFIAEENPQAAHRVSQSLVLSIQRLTDQPSMGRDVEGLEGIQDLITSDYIVRYAVIEDQLFILRIWHGKEDRY